MHRIDSPNAVIDKFGTGKNGWTEGTPGVTPPTEGTDDYQDAIQEEIAGVVEYAGKTLVKADNTQLLDAIRVMLSILGTYRWTERAPAVAKIIDLNAIVWVPFISKWVAVGDADGADSYILTSLDGVTWSEQAAPDNVSLFGICHNGSNLIVAVGNWDGGDDTYIVTSANGTAWTERATPTNTALNGVAYNGTNLYVAVGAADGVDSHILSSPDGTTWTERAAPADEIMRAVCHNGTNLWVAVGDYDGATDAAIYTSPDGTTWTERANPSGSDSLYGVCFAKGLFVAVGGAGLIMTSPDGITWTDRSLATTPSLKGVAYDGVGLFVAVGFDGSATVICTSVDGITWTRHKPDGNGPLNAVGYDGSEYWTAVGDDDGTNAEILTSQRCPIA